MGGTSHMGSPPRVAPRACVRGWPLPVYPTDGGARVHYVEPRVLICRSSRMIRPGSAPKK